MAKKKKKKYRKTPPRRVQRPSAAPAADAMPPASKATPIRHTRFAAAAKHSAPRDWAHEYRYVIADLKRMALTTVVMFALLFVLAIVVPLFLQ
jgi:hypothetical protein